MSEQNKKIELAQIPYSELKTIISVMEAGITVTEGGVKSSYTLEQIKEEVKFRDWQIDNIYKEANTRYGSTLKKLNG